MTFLIALIIGYGIGLFAFNNIILPPFWAWPRANALGREGRLARPIPVARFLVAPLVWSSLVAVSLLLAYTLIPSALGGYLFGLVAAAGQTVRLVFSPNADMEAEFADTFGAHLVGCEPHVAATIAKRTDLSDNASWLEKGQSLAETGRHEEALRCYESAAQANPESWAALEGKGLALHSLERFEEALECFDRAAEVGRHAYHWSWVWNYRAASLRRMARLQDALECCEKAIKSGPTESAFWVTKGNVLSDLRRFEEALACHSQAVGIWRQNPEAWLNTALIADGLGHAQDAIGAYRGYLGLVPSDAPQAAQAQRRLRALEAMRGSAE